MLLHSIVIFYSYSYCTVQTDRHTDRQTAYKREWHPGSSPLPSAAGSFCIQHVMRAACLCRSGLGRVVLHWTGWCYSEFLEGRLLIDGLTVSIVLC